MTLDPVFLSRLQWVWVIAWHILLPAFTVGLASYIAVLEGLFFFRREDVWLRLSRFWIRIFAVSFAMGVVSGIVMPFQFGTNWSRFSDAVANVVSPMMAYEGLMAFFLEAAFLGIFLFGRRCTALGAFFRCVQQHGHTGCFAERRVAMSAITDLTLSLARTPRAASLRLGHDYYEANPEETNGGPLVSPWEISQFLPNRSPTAID